MAVKSKIKSAKRTRKKMHLRKRILGTPEKPRLAVFPLSLMMKLACVVAEPRLSGSPRQLDVDFHLPAPPDWSGVPQTSLVHSPAKGCGWGQGEGHRQSQGREDEAFLHSWVLPAC